MQDQQINRKRERKKKKEEKHLGALDGNLPQWANALLEKMQISWAW